MILSVSVNVGPPAPAPLPASLPACAWSVAGGDAGSDSVRLACPQHTTAHHSTAQHTKAQHSSRPSDWCPFLRVPQEATVGRDKENRAGQGALPLTVATSSLARSWKRSVV